VGYPLVLSEMALGRKTQKGTIEAYKQADPRFTFNGVLQTVVPWLLMCFYCTFGGFITKYFVDSIGALFDKNAPVLTSDPGAYFNSLMGSTKQAVLWMTIFLAITMVIVFMGVQGGIEKFCKFALPVLFFMLLIMAVRSCMLKGASGGLKFLFKPDFSTWDTPKKFLDILYLAGGQMFFSLSLSSAAIITYGSYLGKEHDLEKDAAIVTIGDSAAALLAALAIMPAVFAFGLEPSAGPGLLFVSMTTVFKSLGAAGRIFQLMFWFLVFLAVLSSSIGIMEAGISSILDIRIKKGKPAARIRITLLMTAAAFAGNFLTAADHMGSGTLTQWFHILGQKTVLDVWDCIAEGVLMPVTGLIMAVLIGWVVPHYLDDEISLGGRFRSRRMYDFCIRWLGPVFMILIIYGQIRSFWGK
jgi:NSS family neurotransmitter:Na+ symporter